MGAWKISKDGLEAALNVLLTVPFRNGIDTSEYIKIERYKDNVAKLSLSSDMSGCVYLTAEKGCPFKDPVYIDRRMLEPFVSVGKELTPGYYELKVIDGGITLRHGARVGTYTSSKKAKGYVPAPKIDSKAHTLSEDIASLLSCARHIAVDDPVAPQLSCVYVYPSEGRLRMLSANGHIFFSASIKLEKNFSLKNAALPLPLIDSAKTENNVELLYSDKLAMLKFSCGTLWHPVKSEARKNFPRKIVEEKIKKGLAGETLLHMDAGALFESANRASKYMADASDDDPVLKIETKKGDSEIRMHCKATGAEFSEQIKLNDKASKGDVSIQWPLSAILPILDYSRKAGEAKISKDPDGRTCFSAGRISMLIGRREKKTSTKKKAKKGKKK